MGMKVYGAVEGWGGVELNNTFIPVAQNVDGARLMLEANIAGRVSDETLHEAFQRAELVSEETTFEMERERLSQQGPSDPSDEDRSGEDLTDDPPPEKARPVPELPEAA